MQHALEGTLDDWPLELRGPKLKVERAIEHAKAFNDELDAFLASQPYEIVSEFAEQHGCFELRIRVHREPPPVLSVILGDLIHNARSALDHIAWALAIRELGIDETRRRHRSISFPVCEAPEQFAKRTKGLYGQEATAVLGALQPYSRRPSAPADDIFSVLTELWNIDKHRAIHVSLSALDITTLKFRPRALDLAQLEGELRVERQVQNGEEIGDGTTLMRIWFPHGADPAGTGIDVTEQPSISVTFGARGVGSDAALALAGEVGAVFGYFVPLFAG